MLDFCEIEHILRSDSLWHTIAQRKYKYVIFYISVMVRLFYWKHHRSKLCKEDMDLQTFDLSIIVEATNNFSSSNKLGEGGFGPVYKVI